MTDDRRWPASVYGAGHEPDPRFSLANERTLLAWIRTALALVGPVSSSMRSTSTCQTRPSGSSAHCSSPLGGLTAIGAWLRWASIERALRNGRATAGASARPPG